MIDFSIDTHCYGSVTLELWDCKCPLVALPVMKL
jgi:hypothetical protein